MQRELVERAMAGDHEAFSELARVSIGRLYVVARLIVRDDDTAEDATQEALVAAWSDLGALRDPDRFDAWLHRLLVRACYREAERRRRRGSVEVHVPVLEAPVADSTTDLADRDQLERGFRRLDTDQRAVLVLITTSAYRSTRWPRFSESRPAPSGRGSTGRPARCVPRSMRTPDRCS